MMKDKAEILKSMAVEDYMVVIQLPNIDKDVSHSKDNNIV